MLVDTVIGSVFGTVSECKPSLDLGNTAAAATLAAMGSEFDLVGRNRGEVLVGEDGDANEVPSN